MKSIGILLPGSTLYPSIGIDFLQGIRSCFSFHNYSVVEIHLATIGYGLKEDEIYREAEKFILINNVDVVVVYAGDHLANKLAPLFNAAGKLLIITNAGANYPIESKISNTIFHSLNDCVCTFLTGKLCAHESISKKAVLATSFYDGGYHHAHAMSNGFMIAGGEINFNFVSPLKKEDFNTEALESFIVNNSDTQNIMGVLSADMARCFYEKIEPTQKAQNLALYGSPMMFDVTPGDFSDTKPAVHQIKGYTAWIPGLENNTNLAFMNYFLKEHSKEANIFTMQGWEIALLLKEYLDQQETTGNIETAIENIKRKTLISPRGELKINENNLVSGPAYLVAATGNMELTIEDEIHDTTVYINEMVANNKEITFSNWRNTYLCI